MKSADLHTKIVAFDELMTVVQSEASGQQAVESESRADILSGFLARNPEQSEAVKLGLIQMLTAENHLFIESKVPPPAAHEEDDVSGHYADLIYVVSSLDDERTIPALIGAMTTGGMAQRGLQKYGDKALGPVTQQLKNPDALVRATALEVSVGLLRMHDDVAAKTRVRELLLASISDPEPVVRRQAIRNIDCLEERQEFVPILEQVAKTDPVKRPGKADDGGETDGFYPVRFEARRALRHIRANTTCSQ
jgi:hypothetical protein